MLLYDIYDTYWNKYADPRIISYPLMGSPVPMIILMFGYWYMIKKGPQWMANRPAYNIKTSILIYNIAQIVVCGICGVHGMYLLLQKSLRCITHYGNSDYDLMFMFYTWLYCFGKAADLLDTLFFILRKKFSLVTTLHTYHHLSMLFFSVLICRYVPGGELAFIAALNCIVHSVMYSYYFYCLYSGNKQDVWWKKHITQMQLVQFGIQLCFCLYKLFFVPDCDYPKSIIAVALIQVALILNMFVKYYYHAFLKRKTAF